MVKRMTVHNAYFILPSPCFDYHESTGHDSRFFSLHAYQCQHYGEALLDISRRWTIRCWSSDVALMSP